MRGFNSGGYSPVKAGICHLFPVACINGALQQVLLKCAILDVRFLLLKFKAQICCPHICSSGCVSGRWREVKIPFQCLNVNVPGLAFIGSKMLRVSHLSEVSVCWCLFYISFKSTSSVRVLGHHSRWQDQIGSTCLSTQSVCGSVGFCCFTKRSTQADKCFASIMRQHKH